VRDHGRPRVDDPARLAGVDAVGLDETRFLAATPTHRNVYVTAFVDLDRAPSRYENRYRSPEVSAPEVVQAEHSPSHGYASHSAGRRVLISGGRYRSFRPMCRAFIRLVSEHGRAAARGPRFVIGDENTVPWDHGSIRTGSVVVGT
jgi:hypothetical protein